MRVIVDSNRLRSDELRWFLASNPHHAAVITDYAWMEAYKGNSIVAIGKSLGILCEFPEQVIILKGTKAVGALDSSSPGLANRMIIPSAKKEFQRTSAATIKLQNGDKSAIPAILLHELAAKKQMDRILADAADLTPALKDIESVFTSAEIKSIRTAPAYPSEVIEKVLAAADRMYHNFRRAHPSGVKAAPRKSRVNAFLYRFALASTVYVVTWIRQGSQLNKRPDALRNDLVDLNFATFGTYFNGLMTADNRLQETHSEMRVILGALGARLPASYDPLEFLVSSR